VIKRVGECGALVLSPLFLLWGRGEEEKKGEEKRRAINRSVHNSEEARKGCYESLRSLQKKKGNQSSLKATRNFVIYITRGEDKKKESGRPPSNNAAP